MSNELITIETLESNHERALAIYQQAGGLDPLIEHVASQVAGFVGDISTKKGRDEIASVAHKVAKSRTAIEKIGLEVASRAKEIPKLIDAERKRVKEALQAIQDNVRQPLTLWEAAEAERKQKLEAIITEIKAETARLVQSQGGFDQVDEYICILMSQQFDMQEYQAEYDHEKALAIATLEAASLKMKQWDYEQGELERLRAEAAARAEKYRIAQIEKDAADKAKKDAEDKAKNEVLKAQLEAEKAKREAAEAKQREIDVAANAEREKQKAVDAEIERQRIAEEAKNKALRDEEAKLKAHQENIDHQKSINNAALADLVKFGLTDAQGKQLITAIKNGKIANISINY